MLNQIKILPNEHNIISDFDLNKNVENCRTFAQARQEWDPEVRFSLEMSQSRQSTDVDVLKTRTKKGKVVGLCDRKIDI